MIDSHVTDPLKKYDFFRCFKCHALLTSLEMSASLAVGQGCRHCGSLQVNPSNPPEALIEGASFVRWLFYMLRPWQHWAVWKFTVLRMAGRA